VREVKFIVPDRISYSVTGQGQPIVLVHGLAGSRRWWRHQQAWLEKNYQVWTLELPGFGASARYAPLEIRAAAELVAAFFERHGIEHPVFVGHSMGGHIGLHVAARVALHGLALVSASALVDRPLQRLMLELPHLAWRGDRRFVRMVVSDGWRSGVKNLWQAARFVVSDNPLEVLPLVRCPTLLVWGELDTWVTKAMGEELLSQLPQAQLEVIAGAAHVPMVDRPERFNAVLKAWLETLPT
jgi:pimeloyl-ACP methyl ester carboxylesterase